MDNTIWNEEACDADQPPDRVATIGQLSVRVGPESSGHGMWGYSIFFETTPIIESRSGFADPEVACYTALAVLRSWLLDHASLIGDSTTGIIRTPMRRTS